MTVFLKLAMFRVLWGHKRIDLSLSDLERKQCEGLFTKDELSAALKGLQTGKSPGSDGLPVEFYSVFWDLLCDPLLAVLNDCFRARFSGWLALCEPARSPLAPYL